MSDFNASPLIDAASPQEPEAAGSNGGLERANDAPSTNDPAIRPERTLSLRNEPGGQSIAASSGGRPDTTDDVEHATFKGTELTLADTLEAREFAERLSPSRRSSLR